MKKMISFFVLIIVLLTACAPSPQAIAKQTAAASTSTSTAAASTPTSTAAASTPTSTAATWTPIPTFTPATAFTGAVTPGSWSSEEFNVFFDKQEQTHVELLISDDGMSLLSLQFTACGTSWGNYDTDTPIGAFSFTNSTGLAGLPGCNFTGTVLVSGVFVAKDKVVGIITVGTQTTPWVATPHNH